MNTSGLILIQKNDSLTGQKLFLTITKNIFFNILEILNSYFISEMWLELDKLGLKNSILLLEHNLDSIVSFRNTNFSCICTEY